MYESPSITYLSSSGTNSQGVFSATTVTYEDVAVSVGFVLNVAIYTNAMVAMLVAAVAAVFWIAFGGGMLRNRSEIALP